MKRIVMLKQKHKRYLRLTVYEKNHAGIRFMNVMDLKNQDQTFSFRKTRSYLSDFRKRNLKNVLTFDAEDVF